MSDFPAPSPPEIIAHRGYSAAAPENTLAALRAALEAGADAVEFDVRTAGDGTPVLFHDATLGRTSTGEGPVASRTLEELRALDAGAWFSESFAGEPIPTLAEALALVSGEVEHVYPEVKGYRELADVDRILEIARAASAPERTVFISMDWGALERIARRDPAVGIGYIVEEAERFDGALERAAGDARAIVDLKAGLALEDPELVSRARERAVEVAVWTVDDPIFAERLVASGVSRITTNQVQRLQEWRRGL